MNTNRIPSVRLRRDHVSNLHSYDVLLKMIADFVHVVGSLKKCLHKAHLSKRRLGRFCQVAELGLVTEGQCCCKVSS
jgi:hypothetical protein